MTTSPAGRAQPPRWGRLLRIVESAPPRLAVVIGIALVVLGIFIVTRPLTSLWLLGVYVGVSAIVSGIADLGDTRRTPVWWNRLVSAVWILGGAAILDLARDEASSCCRSPLAVLLVVGGLGSLAGVSRGRVSERVLAVAVGLSQIAFGVLALLWPDVTLLVVAVLFGVRTVVFGTSLGVARGAPHLGSPAHRRACRRIPAPAGLARRRPLRSGRGAGRRHRERVGGQRVARGGRPRRGRVLRRPAGGAAAAGRADPRR